MKVSLAMMKAPSDQGRRQNLQVFHPPSPALQKTAAHFGVIL